MTIEYRGPGFYNDLGERVCSFHPESMMEFIEDAIEGYDKIEGPRDYKQLLEEALEQVQDVKHGLYGDNNLFDAINRANNS
tara:strand:- start:105 stop:347 length:243 start_codon:yes stop_codon:yes gene_type:complete